MTPPAMHQGVEQLPIHGVSMAHTFSQPDAPTRQTSRVFEMLGDRAIRHAGWKAVARHAEGRDSDQDRRKLYDPAADFSQCDDLASRHPDRLAQPVKLRAEEAERHDVLPLDDHATEHSADRSAPLSGRRYGLVAGTARIDRHASPDVTDRGYRIVAEHTADAAAPTEGVIPSHGSRFGGIVLHVQGGRVHCGYLYCDSAPYLLGAELPIHDGPVAVSLQFERTGKHAGVARLAVQGEERGSVGLPRTWPVNVLTCGMNRGQDRAAPVSDSDQPPFAFTGRDLRVVIELEDTARAASGAALEEQ